MSIGNVEESGEQRRLEKMGEIVDSWQVKVPAGYEKMGWRALAKGLTPGPSGIKGLFRIPQLCPVVGSQVQNHSPPMLPA